jgi:hypothetical protein
MLRRLLHPCCLCICALYATSFWLSLPVAAHASYTILPGKQRAIPDVEAGANAVPVVDPDYIYDQLFYMGTHFLHREAGYDTSLPPQSNGHDEFAAYWTQEILSDLNGFGAQVRRDPFTIKGWQGRPAKVPAFNVEVSVPGAVHPEQVVIIGCHYDGMASSNQSAFDDASGCAIALGIAQAMGQYWSSHHVYPARTLRFVLFDAEEQGLFGSFHYVNSTINGDLPNIVAMINEEQNGIAYPLHYLGELTNPFLPFYAFTTPLQKNGTYPHLPVWSSLQRAAILQFQAEIKQAIPAAFALFRAQGFQNLTYHNAKGQDVPRPIFTPDQLDNVRQLEDTLGASDQYAFTDAGVPCITMAGNFSGDPRTGKPTPLYPAYPFDTQMDTIQLMNTYADGSSHQSQALTLALALPGMITVELLHQPTVLGEAPADQNPIATISDIGTARAGHSLALDARASFVPGKARAALSYAWNFGDGATAQGVSVTHTYVKAGSYTLMLTVSSPTGKRVVGKLITVVAHPTSFTNPYDSFPSNGDYRIDPATQPLANDHLIDVVSPRSLIAGEHIAPPATSSVGAGSSIPVPLLVGLIIVAILLIGGIVLLVRRRHNVSGATKK